MNKNQMKGYLTQQEKDSWIRANEYKFKKRLIELKKTGSPRPAQGTILARALELFSNGRTINWQ